MTRSVSVHGFGSAFARKGSAKAVANDLDLLIVHPSTDSESCQFAIACKKRLSAAVFQAHITMLADCEKDDLQFIKVSRAVHIGVIREECFDDDLEVLLSMLPHLGM